MRTCAILLDYRGADKTARCLESLMDQGLSRIYVVDNSGDPQCSARLDSRLDELGEKFGNTEIRTIRSRENSGFARGVNQAIAADQESSHPHDMYLLINNDALAEPGLLASLQNAIETDEDVVMAAPCIRQRGAGVECGLWYNRYTGILTHRRLPLSYQYVSGCCMLIDSRLIKNRQLLDPDFFMYGEDALLCWNIIKAGHKFSLVRDAYVDHEPGSSSSKAGLFYEYHSARAHALMALKAYRTIAEVPLMLLGRMPALLARAVVRSITFKSPVPAGAFFLAWFPLQIRAP